jgi:hypothetical protein
MSETLTKEQDSKTGFLKDICAYFRDFLDTDFKRQAAPKRNITLKELSTGTQRRWAQRIWARSPTGDQ